MRTTRCVLSLFLVALCAAWVTQASVAEEVKPIRVLIVTGHDVKS